MPNDVANIQPILNAVAHGVMLLGLYLAVAAIVVTIVKFDWRNL